MDLKEIHTSKTIHHKYLFNTSEFISYVNLKCPQNIDLFWTKQFDNNLKGLTYNLKNDNVFNILKDLGVKGEIIYMNSNINSENKPKGFTEIWSDENG